MHKKLLLILIALFSALLTTGCWNYIGLNEMTVVAGVAIDKSGDEYQLSFEIYDLQDTATGEPIKTEIVQSTGKTIFDAVRNAKKRVANKLYFAETRIIIVSEEIAEDDGLNTVMNWFYRDPEVRETLRVVVSQERSAVALLKVDSLTSSSVSADIENMVEKDLKITGATVSMPIYKIYNILNFEGESLTLSAIHLTNNNGEKVCEVNGIALFKEDKLVDYLSSDDSKYYLLAKGELEGGIITIKTKIKSDDTEPQNLSLEIKKTSSSRKYISFDPNNLAYKISTKVQVTIGELRDQSDKLKDEDLLKLQNEAGDIIKDRIKSVIEKIQEEYKTDIIGYGDTLYRSNPKVWKRVKENFQENFTNINTEVECEVEIYNTGFTK